VYNLKATNRLQMLVTFDNYLFILLQLILDSGRTRKLWHAVNTHISA
jgi:hypothetical protein